MSYVIRNGQRIEVETFNPRYEPRKSKGFESSWEFVKLPRPWVSGLARSNSAATYRLAHIILAEAFKRQCSRRPDRGIISLSSHITKMPRSTRRRAAMELVELGLIQLEGQGTRRTLRVTIITTKKRKK